MCGEGLEKLMTLNIRLLYYYVNILRMMFAINYDINRIKSLFRLSF